MFLGLCVLEWCQAPRKGWRGSKRLLLGDCSWGGQDGITWSRVPKPPAGENTLAFKSQSSLWCWGGWLGSWLPWLSPALPPSCGRGGDEWSTKYTKTGSKITIILENEAKPASREAEVDLLCVLTIYGVLMGLFKSCFTLLFNKKHIYHSNHLGHEEHILPLRWRPPSQRATAGICNVIFCATYNVGGRGGGGGRGESSGFFWGGGFCKV